MNTLNFYVDIFYFLIEQITTFVHIIYKRLILITPKLVIGNSTRRRSLIYQYITATKFLKYLIEN